MIGILSIIAGFAWLVIDQGLTGFVAACLLVGVLVIGAWLTDRLR